MRKRSSKLPTLVLMSSLYAFHAQAGVVAPDQQDWMWKSVPTEQQLRDMPLEQTSTSAVTGVTTATQNQAQPTTTVVHEHDSGSNALMWYMIGHAMGGGNNSGSAYQGSNYAPSGGNNYRQPSQPQSAPSKPNPDTSHWYSGGSSSGGNSNTNNSSSSSANKGYSTGGMGATSSGRSSGGFSSSGRASSGGG
jgi:hypothetical protein